jgi:maltose alpha-D-glucosyltransferase/alpha-amylase
VDAHGWSPQRVNVADQRRDHDSLLNWMERLIRRRRESPELGWGRITLLDPGDPAVLAHRADWDDSAIVALHSFAERPVETTLEIESGVEELVDLFGREHLAVDGGGEPVSVALEPYGFRWFRLRRRGQRVAP